MMVGIAAVAEGTALSFLYRTGFREQRERLREVVQSQARLIEVMARYDIEFRGKDLPGGAFAATVEELREALDRFQGFGETGEFTIAVQEGDQIRFLLPPRNHRLPDLAPIPSASPLAEPQRRALTGESGAMVGLDYRGVTVLAAYEPARAHGQTIGVVTKIDLWEVRAPFLRAGLAAGGISVLLIILGLWFFRRIGGTLLNDIREGELLYRSVFENALVGVALHEIITDQENRPIDYRFLSINEAFERLTGLRAEEIEGKTVREVMPGIEDDLFIEAYGRVALTGRPISFERYAEPLDKHFAIYASCPRPRHFSVLFVEITDRVRTTDELRGLNATLEERVSSRTHELQLAKDEMEAFAYSVSHDLRVPLRAVDGYATRLKKGHSEGLDPEGNRLLNVILDNSARMRKLIDDLLELSRVGRKEVQRVPVDMEAMVESVLETVQLEHKKSRIQVSVGALPDVACDAPLIRQAWQNLIANAFKFSEGRDPGLIDIQGRLEDGKAVFSVQDNGVGFDMAYASKLFKPFQRLHLTTEFGGSGVGLSIVDRVIRRHGGEVGGEGRVGEGARIWFSLPIKEGVWETTER